MLRAGVIEPTSPEWASPVVFVPKMDGTMRFCVDYRKLNAVTVCNSYPLLCMDESIDSLDDATFFTTLDCISGYWLVEITEEDRGKTTFASNSGLYRFLRMPFGPKIAPATFQRAVDIILSHVKWETALVYIDDVIVYLRTVTEYVARARGTAAATYGGRVAEISEVLVFRHLRYLSRARHPFGTVGGGATQFHQDRARGRVRTKRNCGPFSGCATFTDGLFHDSRSSPRR